MITICNECQSMYDDEFRTTLCPHDLFPANDGKNNFTVHHESEIVRPEPSPLPDDLGAHRALLKTAREYHFADVLECANRALATIDALRDENHRLMMTNGEIAYKFYQDMDAARETIAELQSANTREVGARHAAEKELRATAISLLNRLDEVAESSKGMFAFAAAHGVIYDGPTWEEPARALAELVAKEG